MLLTRSTDKGTWRYIPWFSIVIGSMDACTCMYSVPRFRVLLSIWRVYCVHTRYYSRDLSLLSAPFRPFTLSTFELSIVHPDSVVITRFVRGVTSDRINMPITAHLPVNPLPITDVTKLLVDPLNGLSGENTWFGSLLWLDVRSTYSAMTHGLYLFKVTPVGNPSLTDLYQPDGP